MATISWISTVGGDWSLASNWQGGVVPGVSDDAVMALTAAETIVVSDSQSVNSVLFDDANADFVITSTGALSAQATLELDGATATLDGPLTAGTEITLKMTGSIVAGATITAETLTGTAGEFVFLNGTITITSGGSVIPPFSTAAAGLTIETDGIILSGPTIVAVQCFAAGTNIATPLGARAVETFVPGDRVNLNDGGTAELIWIGHRRIDCRRHPAHGDVYPVRVRRGAFAHQTPHRDLILSPDHAVYVRDVLIPIRLLLNGTSIVQEARDEVEYFHLELTDHDIIVAEGLAVESYLDTGKRTAFDNFAPRTRPSLGSTPTIREAFGRAAYVMNGPIIDGIRRDLADRWNRLVSAVPLPADENRAAA